MCLPILDNLYKINFGLLGGNRTHIYSLGESGSIHWTTGSLSCEFSYQNIPVIFDASPGGDKIPIYRVANFFWHTAVCFLQYFVWFWHTASFVFGVVGRAWTYKDG